MGKVCLIGWRELKAAARGASALFGDQPLRVGDWIALDGATDEISLGHPGIVVEETKAMENPTPLARRSDIGPLRTDPRADNAPGDTAR